MIRGSSIQRNVQTTRTEGSLISNSFKKLKLEVITKQNSDNSDNCPTVPWTGASYEHSYHIPCRTLLYFEVSTNDALKLKTEVMSIATCLPPSLAFYLQLHPSLAFYIQCDLDFRIRVYVEVLGFGN
jgi:hypothetical protein